MSIRQRNLDHLSEHAPRLSIVEATPDSKPEQDPLVFWTEHTEKPYRVDLTAFATGQDEPPTNGKWAGPMKARPKLINELAPAIREELRFAARATALSFVASIRSWWRLFDAMEATAASNNQPWVLLDSAAGLSDIHRQAAIDAHFDPQSFHSLRRVASVTRQALGLRPLYWKGPEHRNAKRQLPPLEKISLVWQALKRDWLVTVDRWRQVDEFAQGASNDNLHLSPMQAENYRLFVNTRSRVELRGGSFPTPRDLRGSMTHTAFSRQGLNLALIYEAFYPTPVSVRVAFHLCLAGTGWNPQTLLDLPVDTSPESPSRTPFLVTHPGDETRYLLRGQKSRGDSEHVIYGDWKTDRSPGTIIRTLVERSWPLRLQLLEDLKLAESAYLKATLDGDSQKVLDKLKHRVVVLRNGVRSPWLYCSYKGQISWLGDSGYRIVSAGKRRTTTLLDKLVDRVNDERGLRGDERIPYIVPGDFRDAFAAFVWKSTGGSILHVMKALGHKHPRTTLGYLDNTLINAQSARVFRTFSNAMWQEIKLTRRLDATVLAKLVLDGTVDGNERARLDEYRSLRRSRIGVGCLDPHNPPAHVAPRFSANGRSMCPVQRCTLCIEHAVILPESLDGLAMRLAELEWLQTTMSVEAYIGREFDQELSNTKVALTGFDPNQVAGVKAEWVTRIASGEHRPVEFDG